MELSGKLLHQFSLKWFQSNIHLLASSHSPNLLVTLCDLHPKEVYRAAQTSFLPFLIQTNFTPEDVFNWLREDKGLSVHLSEFEMPQGGYSETVDATEIELVTIWAKIKDLSKVTR
jgi:hypothetical protein